MSKEQYNLSTEDRIKKIISDILGIPPHQILLNYCLINDLGADSMDVVEIIMEIETEFGITIPDNVEASIKTVQDLIKRIDNVKSTI